MVSGKADVAVGMDAGVGFEVIAWRHTKAIGAHGRCIGQTDLPVDRRKAKRLAHRIRREARRQGWPRVIHTSPLQRCAAVGRQLRRWGWRHRIDACLMEMDFGAWDGLAWEDVPRADVDAWCADFLDGRPGGGESLRMMFERVGRGLESLVCEAPDVARDASGLMREATGLAHGVKSLGCGAKSLMHEEKSLARDAQSLAHEEICVAGQAQMLKGRVKGIAREAQGLTPEALMLVVAHAGWMKVADWLAREAPLPTDAAQWSAPTPSHGMCRRFGFKG